VIQIINDKFACTSSYKDPQPYFSHNGDFFELKNDTYRPCAKKTGINNLFKGTEQLEDIIKFQEKKGFAHDITGTSSYSGNLIIFPLLIVKSNIYIVRYNDPSNEEKVYGPLPWVGYRSNLERKFVNLDDSTSPPSGGSPLFFSIVNVAYFSAFLEQIQNQFKYKEKINMLE